METKENGVELSNRLIAEFMGYDYHKGLFIHREAKTPIGNTIKPDELKYHSSYDWLRPVFDKWNDLPRFEDSSIESLKNNYTARIAHEIAYGTCERAAEIMATAIQWYNTQTTTPSLPGDNNLKYDTDKRI